ncbi:MAG: leucine-rich repeat protein, partial [Oscillospiraceae bacterium]|nr:leucine-rich repeat protein [Oscillospiraceae bacterium]
GYRGLAFANKITELEIPASLTDIDGSSIGSCAHLENIFVHEDNPVFTSVDGVLYSKDEKTLVSFPAGRYGEFYVPEGTEVIGTHAFWSSNLNTVCLADTVTRIEDYGFYVCQDLEAIEISESLKFIGDRAFENCDVLKDVYYKGTLFQWNKINIGSKNNCLLNADIHADVLHESGQCGENVQWNLYDQTLYIEGYGEMYNYESSAETPWAEYKDFIQGIFVENDVEYIGENAFADMSNLYMVNIRGSVCSIGSNAFANSTLRYITYSNNVSYVGENAFNGRNNLKTVYYAGPSWWWYDHMDYEVESGNGPLYDANVYYNVVKNANWCTVRFETGVPGLEIPEMFVVQGFKFTELPNIEREGYVLDSWWVSPVYSGWSWTTHADAVMNNTCLYAKWTKLTTTGTDTAPEGTVKSLKLKNESDEYIGKTINTTVYSEPVEFIIRTELTGTGDFNEWIAAKSSNNDIAAVTEINKNEFYVSVRGGGKATLTFSSAAKPSVKATVTINSTKMADSVELDISAMKDESGNYVFVAGQSYTAKPNWINGKAWPEYVINIPEEFSSVLTLEKGKVKALKSGYAELYIEAVDVDAGRMMRTNTYGYVYDEKVTGISVSNSKVVLDPVNGRTCTEIWAWADNDSEDISVCGAFDVTWTTSPNIRVYHTGNNTVWVEALNSDKGSVTITFKAVDGSGKTAKVTVQTGNAVQELLLDKYDRTIAAGKTVKVAATVVPSDATVKTVEWVSDNPEVATVKNGTIKGISVGETTIFARTQDGTEIVCGVAVKVENPVNSIVFADGIKAITIPLHNDGGEARIPVTVKDAQGNEFGHALKFTSKGAVSGYYDIETSELVINKGDAAKGTITLTATDGTNKKAVLNVTLEQHIIDFRVMAPKNVPQTWDSEKDQYEWTVKEGTTVKPVAEYNWNEKSLAVPKSLQKYEIITDATDGITVDNAKGTFKAVKPGKYDVTFRYTGGCENCAEVEDITITLDVTAKDRANTKEPKIVIPETIWTEKWTGDDYAVEIAEGSQVQLSATVSGQKPANVNVEWFAVDKVTGEEAAIISNKGKLDLSNSQPGDRYEIVMKVTDKKYPDNENAVSIIVEVTEKADAAEITLVNEVTGENIVKEEHKPSTIRKSFVLSGIEGTAGLYEVKSTTPKTVTVAPIYDNEQLAGYAVTYVGVGNANIAVTAKDGSNVKRNMKFKVEKYDIPVSKIEVPVKTLTINAGQIIAVDYKVAGNTKTGDNATNPVIMWSVSDKRLAHIEQYEDANPGITISNEGKINIHTSGATGKVTITGKAMDGSNKTVKFTLNIVDWDTNQVPERMTLSLPSNVA